MNKINFHQIQSNILQLLKIFEAAFFKTPERPPAAPEKPSVPIKIPLPKTSWAGNPSLAI